MSARRWVGATLRGYHRWVSPLLPAACRFVPSCSVYAAEAVETFGVFKGSLMACLRLLRCNPWSRGGFDPLPACPRHSGATDSRKRA